MEQKLWAVDLNLWYEDSVGLTQLMLFVTGGKLDNKNCVFEVPPPIKEKKKVARRRYEELDDEVCDCLYVCFWNVCLSIMHMSVYLFLCLFCLYIQREIPLYLCIPLYFCFLVWFVM